ncbi:MAG: menaquinone-dependent protoporphyrinogen IX dehydrogenase [Alphaproteobacteria bacterium]|nr:menaquinone-dependent protoporphyrinogen IX dehydrogenase [Alphaproteobacteria bacterium]
MALIYASHDGQTRKVAFYLAEKLMDHGLVLTMDDLNAIPPSQQDMLEPEQIILLAPVRHGHHLSVMDRFVHKNRIILETKSLVVVSLNLTARKKGKDTPETNPYMRKWIKKLGIHPEIQAVFAGKLEYARYRWWEKQMIRVIMKITGGPTNLGANIDFTQWDRVDALAAQIALTHKKKKEQAA